MLLLACVPIVGVIFAAVWCNKDALRVALPVPFVIAPRNSIRDAIDQTVVRREVLSSHALAHQSSLYHYTSRRGILDRVQRLETEETEVIETESDDSPQRLRGESPSPVVFAQNITDFGESVELVHIQHSDGSDDFTALLAHDCPVVEVFVVVLLHPRIDDVI